MSAATRDKTNGHLSDAAARTAARRMWREAEAQGETLTGIELGRVFGKTDRWGRKQIELARSSEQPAPSGTLALVPRNGDRPAKSSAGTGGGVERNGLPAAELSGMVDGVHLAIAHEIWSLRIIRWVTTAAVIVVAACAARSSYDHQREVVELAGNHNAWYLPLSVDGMMLIASLNMLVRRWSSERADWLTWAALLLGGFASRPSWPERVGR